MHSYKLQHILARLRFPLVVQLLMLVNDLAYMHMRKNKSSVSAHKLYYAIDHALDQAIQHYKLA